jgi:hypothetical protein
MKLIRFIMLVFFGLIISGLPGAHAVTIDLVPTSTNLLVGGGVDLDLVISGSELAGYVDFFDSALTTGNDLGTFDLNMNYDPTMLLFNSYSLGDQLGNIGLGDAADLSSGDSYPTGVINIAELSLIPLFGPGDLSFQSDHFILATLSFKALSIGNTSLFLSDVILGDFNGDPLTLENVPTLSLAIEPGQGYPVPEPATIVFLGAGLAGLGVAGRLRRQRR